VIKLESIPADEYTHAVLPYSASLWAEGRSFEQYVSDLRFVAKSGYGRRRFSMWGVRVNGDVATSFKRYERDLRCGERMLRAIGIGAVFTREEFRGQGLATAMLGTLLDDERKAGTDVAILYSNIRPHFYEELGFTVLPSRIFTLRADSLAFERIQPTQIRDDDWPSIARCFASIDEERPIALHRTPLVWELIRSRYRVQPEPGHVLNLAIRAKRRILAYCLGRRVVRSDAFVVDEFSYAGAQHAHLIPPLLRAAAGDLRKISGWLPPSPARDVLPRGTVRQRRDQILMVAPLSTIARSRWKTDSRQLINAASDAVWSTDIM
jgi:GNAT superfamily N-acetyltransferase